MLARLGIALFVLSFLIGAVIFGTGVALTLELRSFMPAVVLGGAGFLILGAGRLVLWILAGDV